MARAVGTRSPRWSKPSVGTPIDGSRSGNLTDHADPVVLEAEEAHGGSGHADHDQGPGPGRAPSPQCHQQRDAGGPHGQRRPPELLEPAEGLPDDLVDPLAVLQLDAQQMLQLAGSDEDGRRRREAAEDRPGEEADHEPEPPHTEGDPHEADHDGQRGRQPHRHGRVAVGQLGQSGGGEQRADGGRPDPELAGPTDGGVCHQGEDGGIQPDLGRQPGQEGVAHALRDEHRPHGEPRDDVAFQVRPAVAGQPLEHPEGETAAGCGRDGAAAVCPPAVTSHARPPARHYIATGAHAQAFTPPAICTTS